MLELSATIILPTTGDRGPLLPYSIGSVLRQTLSDFELFIIGDGLTETTRKTIRELQAQDARIRLFDHPKHPRRGEVYRHAALAEAQGRIVAYLCDRDLWLPDHLAVLNRRLQDHDLAINASYDIERDYKMTFSYSNVPFGRLDLDVAHHRRGVHRLSSVGHTLAAYRNLPAGWRTTPEEEYTDRHMWRQFLEQPDLRVYNEGQPTFLYFERGSHPGWPTEKRLVDLRHWAELLEREEDFSFQQERALEDLLNERLSLWRQLQTARINWRTRLQARWRKLASPLSKPTKPPRW